MFDGALGIITALSALKVLKIRGMLGNLKRPVEVTRFMFIQCVVDESVCLGCLVVYV